MTVLEFLAAFVVGGIASAIFVLYYQRHPFRLSSPRPPSRYCTPLYGTPTSPTPNPETSHSGGVNRVGDSSDLKDELRKLVRVLSEPNPSRIFVSPPPIYPIPAQAVMLGPQMPHHSLPSASPDYFTQLPYPQTTLSSAPLPPNYETSTSRLSPSQYYSNRVPPPFPRPPAPVAVPAPISSGVPGPDAASRPVVIPSVNAPLVAQSTPLQVSPPIVQPPLMIPQPAPPAGLSWSPSNPPYPFVIQVDTPSQPSPSDRSQVGGAAIRTQPTQQQGNVGSESKKEDENDKGEGAAPADSSVDRPWRREYRKLLNKSDVRSERDSALRASEPVITQMAAAGM